MVKRKNLDHVLSAIAAYNNNAFYTVENIRSASEGIFPLAEKTVFSNLFRKHRKSK